MNPSELRALAAFQSRMLEVLSSGGTAQEMKEALESSALNCGLSEYVRSFDSRMLIVASELVRKWGKKEART